MSSYRPIDSKREEYRKYLEKTGALGSLTNALLMLYEEPDKPADSLEFVRKQLGDNRAVEAELKGLRANNEALKLKLQSVEEENKLLKEKLAQYEPIEKVDNGREEPVVDSTSANPTTEVEDSAE